MWPFKLADDVWNKFCPFYCLCDSYHPFSHVLVTSNTISLPPCFRFKTTKMINYTMKLNPIVFLFFGMKTNRYIDTE
jgi:hypothetical protein